MNQLFDIFDKGLVLPDLIIQKVDLDLIRSIIHVDIGLAQQLNPF